MLVKGLLLFVVLALLLLFFVLGVEYFLWLGSTGRLVLLLFFLGVACFLLFRYVLTPLFYLFKLKRGLTNKEASTLIGKHFPNIGDKLYNLLDLAEDAERSELLVASIEQRSEAMGPIPFAKAVDLSENLKYTKYLIIPVLLGGLIWLSGNWNSFFGSADRVVHFDMAYEPPAPFQFLLLTDSLRVLESESYTIQVATKGDVRPEEVSIVIDGKTSFLQQENGRYTYEFKAPLRSMSFYFEGGGVRSRVFSLDALKTPVIEDFKLSLDFPKYTERTDEILNSTGNATIPEGTRVKWEVQGRNTDNIHLITADTMLAFQKDADLFQLTQAVYSDFPYELATSNKNVRNHETLAYNFSVVKDAYPKIKVHQTMDSLNPNTSYYEGSVSDDYRLSSIKLVCYPRGKPEALQTLVLKETNASVDQFYYTYPSGLDLDSGETYEFYFAVTDNDGLRQGKTSKSQVFSQTVLDQNQLRNKELKSQESLIDNMEKSLDAFQKQQEALQDINRERKEKSQLNFNDQNQIKDFLQKQQQQENLMQKFSNQLKENLEKGDKDDEKSKLLKERLERQELEAKKNERLLEELQKIADKIDKAELTKRLEELGKKQQNSERSLEQLLELTKRYYVTEKASQLAKDLAELAKRQEQLSEKKIGEDFSDKEQQELNEEFDSLAKELDELKKDNERLAKPMELAADDAKKESVKQDQDDALKEIKKHQDSEQVSQSEEKERAAQEAGKKQKSAARKMQEMSEALEAQASGGGGGSSIAEDAEMLRQILDNLVTFSFQQEALYENLEGVDADNVKISGTVREQQDLRDLFEHVDDSLFALSLRRAELSEFVNEQITEVYYNTDKTLESLAENQIYQGVSYQKYVMNASNSLADFLANILDNMQQSMMPGKGEGEGQDFQLPDIIKGQNELKEKMEGMGEKGQGQPQQGEGQGKEGQGQQSGQSGQSGQEGQSGQGGESGEGEQSGKGKSGKGKGSGEGSDGENGEGQGDNQGKEGRNGGRNGQEGASGSGQGGPSEAELREIYEIYKEQQQIRQKLEQQLQDLIQAGDRKLAQKLIRQMEDFENDLLENGATQRTISKINTIQYELLKLENAAMKQGRKQERESNTNKKDFRNPITSKPPELEDKDGEIELLNRDALPLRPNFQYRVKQYFERND